MFTPSVEMLRLKSVLQALPAGAYITYADLEKASGVPIDLHGRNLLRSAARNLRMEYRSDPGKGIEIASPANSMALVTGKTRRISSSIKRANKCTNNLQKFINDMNQDDRARFIATASLLGAVQAVSAGLSRIYKTPPDKLNYVYNIPIPKI